MQVSDLKRNTSAAIVVSTTVSDFPAAFEHTLQSEPQVTRHHLLVHNSEQKTISIDLIRELKQTTAYRVGEQERFEIILLWAELLSVPAQHALLKLLEEPPQGVRLWLVTPTPQALLETVQSRCVRINVLEKMVGSDATAAADTAASAGSRVSPNLREIELAILQGSSFSQLMQLAATPKDRTEAEAWCQHLLQLCRLNTQSKTYKLQQLLVTALEQLQQNGNVKLVLEQCLFQFKNSQ